MNPDIELPQLDISNNYTADCTIEYSTGTALRTHFFFFCKLTTVDFSQVTSHAWPLCSIYAGASATTCSTRTSLRLSSSSCPGSPSGSNPRLSRPGSPSESPRFLPLVRFAAVRASSFSRASLLLCENIKLFYFCVFSNAKHSVTAVTAPCVLRKGHRRLDVLLLRFRFPFPHGVRCCQQFHGSCGHEGHEGLFRGGSEISNR